MGMADSPTQWYGHDPQKYAVQHRHSIPHTQMGQKYTLYWAVLKPKTVTGAQDISGLL
jgi:hypothetical protein